MIYYFFFFDKTFGSQKIKVVSLQNIQVHITTKHFPHCNRLHVELCHYNLQFQKKKKIKEVRENKNKDQKQSTLRLTKSNY